MTNLTSGRERTALKLSGRGDPVPLELIVQLTEEVREAFARLVEFVVEIGIIDMYTKPTMRPLHYLYQCLMILEENQIQRPTVDELFANRSLRGENASEWGKVYSKEQYEEVKLLFRSCKLR